MCRRMWAWIRQNEGQAMSEYGLILAVVAIALIAGLVSFRTELIAMFHSLVTSISATH